MTSLAHPDPAYVAEVMHAFPDKLERLELDPKLREIAILRVTHRTHAHAACIQHVARARQLGVTDEQITAIQHPNGGPFSLKEQLGLAFADEVIGARRASGALLEHMRSVFSPREMVELLLVIGCYRTVATLETHTDKLSA